MRANDFHVPGEDQSGSADSDRTKRPDHPSSGITARSGIGPAAPPALESRHLHDTLPRAADAIWQSDAATVTRTIVDLRGRALS